MKILLINPPYTNFEGIKESGGHMMPLGIAYLSSYLRERLDCQISILDTEIKGYNYDQIIKAVAGEKPDLVGITCLTPTMSHVFNIAKFIKTKLDSQINIVLGGIHPTALPRETISNQYVDFVITGEGEITFYELIKTLLEKKADFSKIDGLYFKSNNKIISTPKRQLIPNLDDIPFPARDLFELKLYYSAPTKKVSSDQAGAILTSRGCAFNCVHCISKKLWEKTIRFRSTDNVIGEIEECIDKYGIKEFNFFDDTFTLREERALEICDEIINRNLNISWIAFSRVNTITEKLAKRMNEAGCKKISYGLESGSQTILDLMKKNATLEMGRNAVELTVKNKMLAHASFMFGNIGETEETIKKTIEFAKSLPLDNATFFITSPVPGTELYDIAKNIGSITPETKWEEFAPLTNEPPLLVQNNVSKERLVYWQKTAFKKFYLRPKYIMHKIKQLNSVDALKMIFDGSKILYRILIKNPSKS